jgi:thiol-disulfide isomerase/thioredoxin
VVAACALVLSSCGGTTYVDRDPGGNQPLDGAGWQGIEPIALDLDALRAEHDIRPVRDDQAQPGTPVKPGTPVLVNIWASFCGPCKEELPMLQEVSDSGKLVVVGYTRDRKAPDARKALSAAGVGFLNWMDPDAEVALALDGRVPINGIPSSVLVRDGKAVAVHIGPFPDKATVLAALEIP